MNKTTQDIGLVKDNNLKIKNTSRENSPRKTSLDSAGEYISLFFIFKNIEKEAVNKLMHLIENNIMHIKGIIGINIKYFLYIKN